MGLADNYTLQNTNLFDSFFAPIGQWQAMQQNNNTLAQQQEASRLAKAQNDLKIQAQQEAQTLDYNDPNAIHKFIAKYEATGITKGMTDYVANLDAKKRQGMLTDASKVISLVRSGDNANAAKFLRDKALAYKNSGDAQTAAEYEQRASMVETHPDAALQFTQMDYAVLLPKDAAGNYKSFIEAGAPQVKEFSAGGETGAWIRDPYTGEVTYQKLTDNSISPDEQLRANTSITNNTNDNETRVTTANIAADTSRYAADKSSETGIRVANINGQFGVQKEQISQTGQTQRFNTQQANEMNQSEVKSIGGYLMRVYKNGRVDVIGKDTTAAKSPANTAKVAEIQGQNDTANQLIQSLQKAKELNKQGIYSGYGANGRADAMGLFGGTEDSRRTQQYTNIMTGAALQQLKAIFGAAPTEGERAILMKLQASAEYPPQVREQILNDAIAAAQARIASNNRQMQTLGGQVPSAPQQSTAQPQGGYISNKYK